MNIIFLHGALSSSKEFEPLIQQLPQHINCVRYNFTGHGNSNAQIEFESMLNEMVEFINKQFADEPYHIAGYSMGGYMALYAASEGLIKPVSICTIATKLIWNEQLIEKQKLALDYQNLLEKAPAFLDGLSIHFKQKTAQNALSETLNFMEQLVQGNYLNAESMKQINIPVIMLRGDKDHLVKETDIELAVNNIPEIDAVELENTPHLLDRMDAAHLAFVYLERLNKLQGKQGH